MSRSAIKQLQSEDEELMRVDFYLRSGNRALAKDNKCPYVKRYMNTPHAVRMDDGLLVVHRKVPHSVISAEVPIIPRSMAQGILTSSHIKLSHPLNSQMKKAMERYCYSLDQDKIIEDICNHCHLCQSLKKLPKEIPIFQPSAPPEHPGTHWAADVMKYGKKSVLVAADNLSSFTVAAIARSERHEQLQEAIITAISPFKSMALQTEVRVDTAPGLAKLTKAETLLKYGMKLDPGHVKNKDSCAKVDKVMSELRRELEILSPVERILSTEDLCLAVSNLNSRIRHSGLSAREIMFQRSQTTNENIHLKDSTLKDATEVLRAKNLEYAAKSQSNQASKLPEPAMAKVGNLVYLKKEKQKGSARHLYIITKIDDDLQLRIRKILHSLDQFPIKLRPEEYKVRQEDVYLAPNQPKLDKVLNKQLDPTPELSDTRSTKTPSPKSLPPKLRFKHLSKQPNYKTFELDSSESEDEADFFDDKYNDNYVTENIGINETENIEHQGDPEEIVTLPQIEDFGLQEQPAGEEDEASEPEDAEPSNNESEADEIDNVAVNATPEMELNNEQSTNSRQSPKERRHY